MKIAEGVEMLELSMNVMGTIASVCPTVLTDNENMILVDTGYPGQLGQIKDAFKNAGLNFLKINRILITHHDLDHIGCLSSILRELNGKAIVYSHKLERPYVQGDIKPIKQVQLEARLDTLNEKMKCLYQGMKTGFGKSVSKVDHVLSDQDELPYCGGIRIIHTPGHTPGHISLYLEKERILITGDMLFVENGMLVRPQSFVNYDNEQVKQSMEKLSKLDVRKVICYHGGFYRENPNSRITDLCNI